MGIEMVPETSAIFNKLMGLIAEESAYNPAIMTQSARAGFVWKGS
jgi:hypothetical protein